jgi:serine phosphatase RsbU (regulator of sigma subunit)
VFSDGAFEIARADGSTVQLPEFIQQLGKAASPKNSKLDELVAWARAFRGEATLEDDLSIMELEL